MKIPVEVVGVRVEMPSNQPIILLREIGGIRYLPIWVGAVEATAIAFAQQGVEPPRPLTHDLMISALELFSITMEKVDITGMIDGVFYAEITLQGQMGTQVISSRPSDALALAIKTGVPILVSEDLFSQAGIEIPDSARQKNLLMEDGSPLDDEGIGDGLDDGAPLTEGEVERFREFLDQINPDDFLG